MIARSLAEEVAARLGDRPATATSVRAVLERMELPGLGPAQADQVVAALAGAGSLQGWVEREGVTDVLVAAAQVWIDRGSGLELVDTLACPREVATRLAALAGARLDDAHPIVDAQLPSGVRLHAVLEPISTDGVLLSLRVPHPGGFTLDQLAATGMFDAACHELLAELVARRANLIISGATGTGKTTLLSALLALVDPTERIVCVEEASELKPTHPHVVHIQARAPNVEGVGEVSLAQLVRASLRMRPDRLVVGECRGAEVRDVLLALTTGHTGAATVHANAAAEVPTRLVALASLAGISAESARAFVASAFDVVIHVARPVGGRVVEQIAALSDEVVPLLVRTPAGYRRGPGRWRGQT